MKIFANLAKVGLGAILCTSLSYSKSAPNYHSLRALSMGGAHVAVADDYNTIYYNPAGLNNINKLGNYDKRPDLGFYRENVGDMKLGFRSIFPDVLGVGLDFYNFYTNHQATFDEISSPKAKDHPEYKSPEQALADDSTLYNDAQFLDGINVPVGMGIEMAMAWHNFGAALWVQSESTPEFDTGILLPAMKLKNTYVASVGQLQGAYELDPQLAIGAGYRMVKFVEIKEISASIEEVNNYSRGEEDFADQPEVDSVITEIRNNPYDVDHGIDLGAIYQHSREIRFGGSLTNIFINGINDEDITPNLTVGAVYSPRKWQKNTLQGRKLNFAVDFADLLNNDRNYRFFSKVNFGTELEWTLLGIPYLDFEILETRIAGGFKGGYWTAGGSIKILRFVHFAGATWADEDGYFTGQKPNRRYSGEISFGF